MRAKQLRIVGVFSVAIVLAGGMGGGVSPASGAATTCLGDVAGVGLSESDLSKEELTDLTRIASDEGIGADEAVQRFGWQNGFALAATTVEERFPSVFSGSEVTSEWPAVATIRFKGIVPVGVEALLATVPPGVCVVLEPGAGLSASEISDLVMRAHTAVGARPDLVADLVSSYDRATGMVQVLARPAPTDASAGERAAIAKEILAGLPPELQGKVLLVVDPRVVAGGHARYGGGRLEVSAGSSLACTAGFNVIVVSGTTTGVATAGHCGNSLTHENSNGDTEYAMTFWAQHRGGWGDFQWHTTSDTEGDTFYYDWGLTRNVSSMANPSDGQTICRFGQNTGAQCDTVADLDTCSTFDGIAHCKLVRMDHKEAAAGDSGGPWYYGTVAYGYHSGYASCGIFGGSCDVWGRATYIDNALAVRARLLTNIFV
jgi:hypothetical protein